MTRLSRSDLALPALLFAVAVFGFGLAWKLHRSKHDLNEGDRS